MWSRPERASRWGWSGFVALAWLAASTVAAAVEAPAPTPSPAAGSPAKPGKTAAPGLLGELPLSSSDEPILVESKELEFDYQKNQVFYRGDVKAKQGDVTIDCDELVVFFDRAGDVRKAELRAVVATGNVVITQGERRATGGRAVFNQVNRQIALLENPILRDGKNEVRGDRLTVYLDESRSVMESGKGGKERVSAVLYPGSRPEEAGAKKEPPGAKGPVGAKQPAAGKQPPAGAKQQPPSAKDAASAKSTASASDASSTKKEASP